MNMCVSARRSVDAVDVPSRDHTDGVVAIPRERAADVVAAAAQREAKEAAILERIRAGERTLEVYNF